MSLKDFSPEYVGLIYFFVFPITLGLLRPSARWVLDVGLVMAVFAVFYLVVRSFYIPTGPLDILIVMAWHVVPPVVAAATIEVVSRAFPPPRF